MTKYKYTKEILEIVVKECLSFAQVLRALGIKQSGGMQSHIKLRITEYGIDYSHFLGQAFSRVNRNKCNFKKKHYSEILVLDYKRKKNTSELRKALLDSGREHKCEICFNTGNWHDKPLVLQIDHKNGNPYDNTEENLRFLCPNCHSQTENWSGKGRRKGKKKVTPIVVCCIDCGKPGRVRCRSCTGKLQLTEIEWPDIEILLKMLENTSFLQVAKQLGVSDNAIRKHLRNHMK